MPPTSLKERSWTGTFMDQLSRDAGRHATIIRALRVPATVSLFGRWNWYLPDTAAKLLRVKPSRAK
jgi:hypothetical protein